MRICVSFLSYSDRLMRRVWRFALLSGLATLAAGCQATGDNVSDSLDPAAVASISVEPASPVLVVGESVQMAATAIRADGSRASGLDLLWTGGDPLVATISAGGLVSAVGPGSVTITVTGGGRSASVVVTVIPVPVAAVSVTPPTATVAAGGRVTLVGVALDGRGQPLGGRSVDWTSSNPAIASVSDRGEVTGLVAGQVTISAVAGGKTGSAAVTVTEPVAQRIGLAPAFANLLVGQQQPLSIVVVDAFGNQLGLEGVEWSSSAPAVATVDDGLVTAVTPGSATITARVDGATAKANITVAAIEVASVSVTPAYLTLAEGEAATVSAVGLDARGQPVPGQSVTWHSLAPSFATVSPAGVVTALAPGSAAVVASVGGRSGSVTVNSIQAAVSEITLTPGSATIEAGATLALNAQARSNSGKTLDRPISWSSNAPSIATVSSHGVVTGLQAGVAKVTASASGKSATTTITVAPARVASITLAPTMVSLVPGQTADFVATPRDGAGQPLAGFSATWQTSAPTVATVSASGRVTAIGSGTATITVVIDGKTAQASVTVDPAPVMSVAVVPGTATLTIGASRSLVAEARDGAGGLLTGRPVTWRSSRPTVATVSTAGVVTAVAPGSATITATVEGREGAAVVTVTDPPVASVVVAPDVASLSVGASVPLSAEARDAAGNLLSGRTAVWTSATPSVATVSATGVVSAVSTGTTVISAAIDGKTGTASVTVTAVPVASVSVSPMTADLVVGGTRTFSAVARDAAGAALSGRVPAWTSTAPGVATVASNGVVTAVAPGSAVIRATIEGKSATGMVTVTAVPVASVGVTPATASLTVGATRTLSATVRDASGGELAGRPITWSSSHPTIATVSSSGIVTAVAAGTATISAAAEGKVGSSVITVTNVPVASVAISPTTLSLAAGQTQTFTATARDVSGAVVTGRSATWVSDAPSVAAVTPAGRVTAVAAGTAQVTVTIEGKAATAAVTVSPVAVASVVVVPSSVSLRVGQVQAIDATARDAAGRELAGRVVTWNSSAPSVASVSTDGTITAVAAGTATVTAAIEGQTALVAVTVAPVPVATVAVSPAAPSLVVGGSQALTAVAKDSAGATLTGRPVTWTSGTPAVATVSASGVVTAIAPGSATITATSEGKSGTATVTVSAVPVATVAVSPATASLSVGQTQPLSAIAKDAGGATLTGRPVTWSSSNSAVATVSTAGLVTAVAAGSATITASVEGKTGTAAVTVVPPPVATVAVTPLVATVAVGETASFTATPKDAAGGVLAGRPVTWTSDALTVATVSSSGVVTGVGEGTALITATIEGKTASATVTVSPLPVATVAVTPATASVQVGGTTALTAQPRDAAGTPLTGRPVTWATASAAVATVSTSGLVTAVAPGTTVITATSEGKTGTATITVTAVPVATVAVSPPTAALTVGQTQSVSAIARDSAGGTLTGRPVTWSSGTPAVATVSSGGLVTAVAPGTATITATVEGKTGTAAITVTAVPVATVSVTPASSSIDVGQTLGLTATLRDAGGNVLTGRTVSWSSSQPTIATVSALGVVTAIAAGSATITATADGKAGTGAVAVSDVSSGGPPVFPLRVEAGKRYLVDAAGKPFFVSGDSPWLLMVQLTREQIDQYLEDRRLKGINTILVELIESYFATNAPKNVYGQGPFLTPGDFATPNEAYFAHAEYAIAKAAEKGILVLLTPAYMGYNGAEEGWYSAMVANGTTKLRNYGRYLATRFRSHNNIMWVQGGDYNPPNLALLRAIPEGIREIETKWLHTFHGNRGTTPFAFLGTSEPWLGVNNIYTTSSVVPLSNTEYGRSAVPYFMIESYYEGSAAGFTGVSEAIIRRQAYHAVLSGASGHLVGHHAIWTFSSGWQTQLNSQGAQAAMQLRNLFDSRSWWLLEPDRSRVLLTAGHGSNPTEAVASRATDRSFAFLFTPSIRDLTVNMGQMAGPRVQARWYDPTNGTYHAVAGSPFPASGSVVLRPTGNNARGAGDWVLVLDAIP